VSAPSPAITNALAPLKDMLAADGYELELSERGDGLIAEIKATPEACADCLVPKDMMKTYFIEALRSAVEFDVPDVTLIYPADH
jgi:hypothetical protein